MKVKIFIIYGQMIIGAYGLYLITALPWNDSQFIILTDAQNLSLEKEILSQETEFITDFLISEEFLINPDPIIPIIIDQTMFSKTIISLPFIKVPLIEDVEQSFWKTDYG